MSDWLSTQWPLLDEMDWIECSQRCDGHAARTARGGEKRLQAVALRQRPHGNADYARPVGRLDAVNAVLDNQALLRRYACRSGAAQELYV